ncbi:MAG: hypothetical protein WD894_05335 [Pirellulales bacterium]
MRRPVGTAAPGISLFPFLAVLLCTMGALIVVLVVLNRQSRLKAEVLSSAEAETRRASTAATRSDAEDHRDTLVWQIGHLRISREKTQLDLDRERLRLSGVEEHRRELETRLRELQRAAAQLDDVRSTASDGRPIEQELAKLNAEIQSAKEQLAEARQAAAGQAPAYSVVPYEGAHRTRRRPIYIECLGDRVVIQPEGIVLTADDFDGPMGPGNPLASAVRAARDHLAASAPDPKSPEAEPYPLFLVRPDGIQAYYAARAAMQSWGSDFGYQTIDQDWKLEFPPVDSRLAQLERQAVDEARQRLVWLAQMSPDRYGAGGEHRTSGNKVSYRVSPLGGLVREGGPTLRVDIPGMGEVDDRPGDRPSSFGSRAKGRFAAHPSSQESTSSTSERSPGGGTAEQGRLRPDIAGNDGERKNGADGQSQNTRSQMASSAERRYGDLNDRRQPPVGWDKPAAGDGPPGAPAFQTEGSAQTDPETGQSEASMTLQPKTKEKPQSLAETRGENWGLSPAARSSNPITRPIHIVCQGGQLLIRPERPDDAPVAIPMRMRTEDSVDSLVAAVQQRIGDWGIAGRGLYWRPQLVLEVGHSGEGRYADLEALLADSGFDVKRK